MADIYLLNTPWSVWQNYKTDQARTRDSYEACRVLAFTSLNQLAQLWQNTSIRSLSAYFLDDSRRIAKHEVDSGHFAEVSTLSFFRGVTEPKWEHPDNHGGGSFSVVCLDNREALQQIYQNVIFAVVGESFTFSHMICGIRFVDKYLGLKALKLKIDIWVNAEAVAKKDELMRQVEQAISALGMGDKVIFKAHEAPAH